MAGYGSSKGAGKQAAMAERAFAAVLLKRGWQQDHHHRNTCHPLQRAGVLFVVMVFWKQLRKKLRAHCSRRHQPHSQGKGGERKGPRPAFCRTVNCRPWAGKVLDNFSATQRHGDTRTREPALPQRQSPRVSMTTFSLSICRFTVLNSLWSTSRSTTSAASMALAASMNSTLACFASTAGKLRT